MAGTRAVTTRLNTTTKQVSVSGNRMGTLHVQVWTEGRTFVSADPPGFSYSAADERVVWEFSGHPSGASVSHLERS